MEVAENGPPGRCADGQCRGVAATLAPWPAIHTCTRPTKRRRCKTACERLPGKSPVLKGWSKPTVIARVLTQVVSVRKALKSFAEVVIHQHAHQCIEGASDPKEAQRKLRDLLTVLERYGE